MNVVLMYAVDDKHADHAALKDTHSKSEQDTDSDVELVFALVEVAGTAAGRSASTFDPESLHSKSEPLGVDILSEVVDVEQPHAHGPDAAGPGQD